MNYPEPVIETLTELQDAIADDENTVARTYEQDDPIVTQNEDGTHHAAGYSERVIIETQTDTWEISRIHRYHND